MFQIDKALPQSLILLLNQQMVSPLDITFALKYSSPSSEKVFTFLAISSAFWRHGYHFLIINKGRITPSIFGISETDLYQGFRDLPEDICSELFVIDGQHVYLRSLYITKQKLFQKLTQLSSATPLHIPLAVDPKVGLSKEQSHIFQEVMCACFSIICGGPGTGKTFLAVQLILALIKSQPKLRIAIVSPTGKATSHIRQILTNYRIPENTVIIQTVHHFLQEYAYHHYSLIDVLLVDEGSMITLSLLHSLVQTLQGHYKNGCLSTASLIILGDTNQLPPIGIGIGNPFQDLILNFSERTFHLQISHRAKTSEIQNLTRAVLKRELIPFSPLPNKTVMITRLTAAFIKALSSSETRLCVLTPMRYGPWGVLHLNAQIYQALRKNSPELPIPVMITSRYETWGLFNGDTGMLCPRTQQLYFPQCKPINTNVFSDYVYNYVMSVHKSQGSEYDEVIVILPKGSEIFGLSILYTAITRAKYKVSIWTDFDTLHKTINKSTRYTYEIGEIHLRDNILNKVEDRDH
ncbi:exodeoxyribonuclease V subunit alpha [Candidatus Chlamydia sanziniae]|uniref:Exodeoxyribonuclease V alpha chain n=1 Tax=Candidatus Chlamydia sanziniae TaxID=1806891 RepID=A0A1A9HUP7_9CHLA|nr:exodeoxyribonuclease V subunit alpha [Candidatus Chlamydia sanziniae]ANH78555.1 Exodeoxyribonuclease V alpha chain [Candidatus Chlamydia sanziniae]